MVHKPNILTKNKGFTLIEIIVVMVLLGILAGLITPNFISSLKRGRDSRRRQNLTNLKTVLRAYYNDNQSYPASDDGKIAVGDPAVAIEWGDAFTDGSIEYMEALPEETKDPQYYYELTAGSSGEHYTLEACLEIPGDDDADCTLLADCPADPCCPSGKCFVVSQ